MNTRSWRKRKPWSCWRARRTVSIAAVRTRISSRMASCAGSGSQIAVSSPVPVQLTAAVRLAKVPAPMMGVSPTRPEILPVRPPVLVAAAKFPRVSRATQPTVPRPGASSGVVDDFGFLGSG